MLRNRNNDLIFRTLILTILLPFGFFWTKQSELFSSPISIGITFVLLSVAFFYLFFRIFNIKILISYFLLLGTLLVNAIAFKSLGCVLTCYNIFLFLVILNNVTFSHRQVQTIRLLITVLLLSFILTLNIKPNYNSLIITTVFRDEINVNTWGILILAAYFNGFLWFENIVMKRRYKFVIFVAFSTITVYYIMVSQCRSALIAIALFLVLYIFRGRVIKKYKALYVTVVLVALILPYIYLGYVDVFEDFDFFEMFGKSLYTRVYVWRSTIDLILKYPLFGSGTIYEIALAPAEYTDSAHNVFLGLWKTVGIIPMLIITIYLTRGINIKRITPANYTSKLMFLSCMAICALETLLNDSNTYIFYIPLLMTIYEEE